MGVALSWLAVAGLAPDVVQQRLGVAPTGALGEPLNQPLVGRAIPDGWYLLVAQGRDHALIGDAAMAALSDGCAVVSCTAEEHVMYAAASGWRDGRRTWRIEHRSEDDRRHLAIVGDPPEVFGPIRERLAAHSDDPDERFAVDWHVEMVTELAWRLVGFRHDMATPGVAYGTYDVMTIAETGVLASSAPRRWRLW